MANPVVHESKHIFKRILIGVATGVSCTAIIYFLGITRNPSPASEVEIKENTIKAWKSFVEKENNKLTSFDSSLAKINRELITFKERYRQKDSALKAYYIRDSMVFLKSLSNLEELRQTKDIDKEFTILLGNRIVYQKEQMTVTMSNRRKLGVILLDTVMTDAAKNYQMQEVTTGYNAKMESLIERIGRSSEDLAASLSKKYQYEFSMADFKFYGFYLTLKKAKGLQTKPPEVAPPDPNKPAPDLPE